ncbi:hypothetical protein LWI28_007976 [Acer negundo]|uniref:Uncharacterized protein n=1 Tax=Acer negundo TaxID=4023 RepID=A0AAD5NV42_ACENE|nr:hypothetical protein LWI28_007976 [Acer negundo]
MRPTRLISNIRRYDMMISDVLSIPKICSFRSLTTKKVAVEVIFWEAVEDRSFKGFVQGTYMPTSDLPA